MMLYKCEYCFKRYWTKKGRNACESKHHSVSRMVGAQYGQGFGRASNFHQHEMPLETYKVKGDEPTQSSSLGFAEGMLAATALNDLLKSIEGSHEPQKTTEAPKLEPEPKREEPVSQTSQEVKPAESNDSASSFDSLGSSSLGSPSLSSESTSGYESNWSSDDW